MTTFGSVDLCEQRIANYTVALSMLRLISPTIERIRSANESKAVFPRFRCVVEAIELAEAGSKTTSEELKFTIFWGRGGGGGGMPPDSPIKCVHRTHFVAIGLSTFCLLPTGLGEAY